MITAENELPIFLFGFIALLFGFIWLAIREKNRVEADMFAWRARYEAACAERDTLQAEIKDQKRLYATVDTIDRMARERRDRKSGWG